VNRTSVLQLVPSPELRDSLRRNNFDLVRLLLSFFWVGALAYYYFPFLQKHAKALAVILGTCYLGYLYTRFSKGALVLGAAVEAQPSANPTA
jgi:hypothetical protein